jgi:hypothetical protein
MLGDSTGLKHQSYYNIKEIFLKVSIIVENLQGYQQTWKLSRKSEMP